MYINRRQNAALTKGQQELRALNEQLEVRVAERTTALSAELARLARALEVQERIFALSLDIVGVVSLDGTLTRMNPAAERTLGFPLAEMGGRHFLDFVHPDERDDATREFGRLAAGAPSTDFECRILCCDGSDKWFAWTGAPDVANGAVYVVGREITGRKRAQESLLRLRKAVDTAGEVIFLTDPDGTITYVNPEFTRLYGYTAGEVVGKVTPRILKSGLVTAENYEWFWKMLLDKQVMRGEMVNKTKDGRFVDIDGSANTILGEGGQIIGFLAVQRDIGDRKRMEQALRESEERYRRLVEASPDGIAVHSGGPLIFANQAMATMLGAADPAEMVGLPALSFVHPDYRVTARQRVLAALDGGDLPSLVEEKLLRLDGKPVDVEVATVPFSFRGENAVQVVVRDISRRKLAEQALLASERRERLILNALPLALYTAVPEGDYGALWVSDGSQHTTGFPAERFVAEPRFWVQRLHPDDREQVWQEFMLIHERGSFSAEYRWLCADGVYHWFLDQAVLVRDELGRPEEVNGVWVDISERKRIEERLRESEEQYRSLVESTENVIYMVDRDCRYLFANGQLLARRNLTVEQIVGRHYAEFHEPQDAVAFAEKVTAVLETGRSVTYEHSSTRGNGVFLRTLSPVESSDRLGIRAVTVMSKDITPLKRAENALRESEAKFRRLAETTTAQIAIVQDMKVRYANPALVQSSGYARDELLHVDLRALIHPDFQRQVAAGGVAPLDRHGVGRYEFQVITKGGAQRWLDATGALIEYEGHPAILATAYDITERKWAETELQRTVGQLRKTLEGTIAAMALTVETRDPYTAGHQRRVAELACAIAQEMGMTDSQVDVVRMAGVIHDVGKISVPAEILSRPSRISPSEFRLVKVHPQVGHDILRTVDFPWPIDRIVLQHHERLDGSGYPAGLSGDDILLEARILSVADVVEAMSSHRPYRPALGIDEALAEISGHSGSLYDADVVAACARLFADARFCWG